MREEGSFPDGYEWRGDYPEDLEKLPSNQAIKESEHHKYEDMNAELEQHALFSKNDYFEWAGARATLLPPAEIKARKKVFSLYLNHSHMLKP